MGKYGRRCRYVKWWLSRICLQFQTDSFGRWRVHQQSPTLASSSLPTTAPEMDDGYVVAIDADGANDPPSRVSPATMKVPPVLRSLGTSGCDPRTHWTPAQYAMDPCRPRNVWSKPDRNSFCNEHQGIHRVEITLRSAADPFLHAKYLTEGSLDFGSSPVSQRIYA